MLSRTDVWNYDPTDDDPEAAIVGGIMRMIAQRDPEKASHLEAVGMLAHRFAAELGFSEQTIRRIAFAARLHDVGEHAVPLRILRKSSALDEDEWRAVRFHSEFGASVVVGFPHLSSYERVVRSHHERIDGTGYPDGLIGDQIPYEARVIAVVDAFHAMTVSRPFSEMRTPSEAMAELIRCAGTQFDADFVRAFARMMNYRERNLRLFRSA